MAHVVQTPFGPLVVPGGSAAPMPAFIQAPGQVVRWMTVDTFTRVPGWNKLRVHMVFNDDRIPGWSRNGRPHSS